MKFLNDKRWLFAFILLISILAGISNFLEPANMLVTASIGLSLIVVMFGSEMAILYLLIALCPFYASLRIGNLYVGFIIPLLIIGKLLIRPSKKHSPVLIILSSVFFIIWLFHDIQFVTFATGFFRLLVPICIFIYIYRGKFKEYDGYYAMWIVVATTLISMICIFMVQGGSIDAFISASYVGEMRLGEADTDDGQKNQLGGAMGFPIYTIIIVSLLLQMLLTRKFKLWVKASIVSIIVILFFITFLTISRVYLLGLVTLSLLLVLHMSKSRSFSTVIGLLGGSMLLLVFASLYLDNYINDIIDNYLYRIAGDSGNSGTGIRGLIYNDCIYFLTEDIECLLIGKGSTAYPLLGQSLGRLFGMSAHNIILDAIMSFGLYGLFLLLYMYWYTYKKEEARTYINWSIFRIIPLACYIMMNMTATPFLLDKTYPMLLFMVLNINHCTDNTKYNPKWALANNITYKKI